tara:strand:- start:11713 stop:12579 length:867 start_codon:yes stop_codon:yes gene_type:complete
VSEAPGTGANGQRIPPLPLDERSYQLRHRVLRIMDKVRRGHLGAAFSLMEIVRVLYDDVLNYDAKNPTWEDRDRLVFSKGHGCLALYVLLSEKGFFPDSELDRFCEFGSILGGHPVQGHCPGVEASTGALGHGLSIAVGMALAARIDDKKHRVFALLGDGECQEGSVWEAALSAGKHGLDNLTVMVDRNHAQCFGPTSDVQVLEPFADKWRSFGFNVRECDGHDLGLLRENLGSTPWEAGKPNLLVCHTLKGRGLKVIEENAPKWHHSSRLADEKMEMLYKQLEESKP